MHKRIQMVSRRRLSVVIFITILCLLPISGGRARPLYKGNFTQINENGFGDPNNSFSWSMAWFKDRLYVGTIRNVLELRVLGGVPYDPPPVPIPDSITDLDLASEIWQYTPGHKLWKRVFKSETFLTTIPEYPELGEVEVPRDQGYRIMCVYTDPKYEEEALYVGTNIYVGDEARILRTADGESFQALVFDPGMELPEGIRLTSFRSFVPFEGRLYTTPVSTGGTAQNSEVQVVFESVELDLENSIFHFRPVSPPNFGDETNLVIFEMAALNGYLYAGTGNLERGYQIWKSDASGEPPYVWTPVVMDGAYRGPLNQGPASMYPFKGRLYVGSGIQNAGVDPQAALRAEAELIRINPDDSWDLICGEERRTPDGLKVPLSGMEAGFGNSFNAYFWRMQEHDDWLYLGTNDNSTYLRHLPLEHLPPQLKKLLELIGVERIVKLFGGFDLWKTKNGVKWYPVTTHGFGNPLNIGCRTLQSTPYGLFLGTTNGFTAGDSEGNLGGTEVWLGTEDWLSNGAGEDGNVIIRETVSKELSVSNAAGQLTPGEFALHQNYPSPCNPETWIPYQLPQAARVRLDIHDLSGQLVRSIDLGHKEAGFYMAKDKAIHWDGTNTQGEVVASGIYFYQIHAGDFVATRKTMILK